MTELNRQQAIHTPVKNDTKPDRRRTALYVAGALLAYGLCFAAGYGGGMVANQGQAAVTEGFPTVKSDGNKILTTNEASITSVAQKVSPSVVSILTSGTQSTAMGVMSYEAAGSGMIVSKNGYVMTNKHVIEGTKNATIVTSAGQTYKNVPVVGSDPLNDIAFLKVPNVNNLTPVSLGDSKTVHIGESVIAIGNALGQYQNTVTSGIVSGLGRPVVASTNEDASRAESLSDLIQTDAAINSGNSGGPLLNTSGQVIGINTAVAQDAQGIGFAIPIGAAKGMINHLLATGKVEHAIVGMQYIPITPDVKQQLGVSVNQGDYISSDSGNPIQPNSPAARAGIKKGDIITQVNGIDVAAGKSTSTLIGEFEPGKTVTLTILRNGTTIKKTVTLVAYN